MTTQAEIDARIAAMGRPTFTNITDAVRPALVHSLRLSQGEWDLAHPELAAERAKLLRESEALRDRDLEMERAKAEAHRAKANLRAIAGPRVADALEKAEPTPPLLSAQEWWLTESWCLGLIGELGVGKSVGAGHCALKTLEAGKRVLWLDERQAGTSPVFGVEGAAKAARARDVDLLVVDDLGAVAVTEFWKAWLDSVLSVRHARNRRTVLTSNHGVEKFKAHIGERMVDRIREGGVVRDFKGESLRRRRSA